MSVEFAHQHAGHDRAIAYALAHGTRRLGRPLPAGIRWGIPRSCYLNALILSLSQGLAYVEGVSRGPHVLGPDRHTGVWLPHAWNEDEAGGVIDNTWQLPRPAMTEYVGIRFGAARAHETTWHGDASVLLDRRPGCAVNRGLLGEPSPGPLAGLVEVVAGDMERDGTADHRRLAHVIRTTALAEGWPSL